MSACTPRVDDRAASMSWRAWIEVVRAAAHRCSFALASILFGAVALLNIAREIGTSFNLPPGVEPGNRLLGNIPGLLITATCQWACLVVAVAAGDEAVERGGHRRRSYLASVTLACLGGAIALFLIRGPAGGDLVPYTHVAVLVYRVGNIAAAFVDALIVCGLSTFVYVSLRDARQAGRRLHAAEIARLAAAHHVQQSRLQAVQARVEPQFLFDTLARVGALYETDAVVAGKLLDDLIDYFRAALLSSRDRSSTIGQEVALARAYLDIVRARPGGELAFVADILPAHAHSRMPPMLLLPLIDHALARVPRASQDRRAITLETATGDGKLLLSIADTDAGFDPAAHAPALDAIRARLQALHGNAASLRLERHPDRGSRAVLEIPHAPIDRGHR